MPRGPKNAGASTNGATSTRSRVATRSSRPWSRPGSRSTLEALAPRFEIHTEQHRRALEARMRAMVRDGQLLRNRADEYCLTGHLDVVTGIVLAHRDGFGFLAARRR